MSEMSVAQEEVTYCAVHTDKEASLRCIRCERYMCIKCVVQSPVGYICRECARQQDNRFFNASSNDSIIVFSVCAILTGIGAAIISATGFPLFFLLFLGLPIGGVIGEAALRATKRRRGRYSHWIAAAGAVIGGFAGGILQMVIWYNNTIAETVEQARRAGMTEELGMFDSVIDYVMSSVTSNWSLLLFIAIIAFAVYSRYKMRL
jgi:hypothetical protein